MCVYLPWVGTASVVRRNVVIPDDLDERFRQVVAQRKGIGKGNLSDAICEAIEAWIARG